MRERYIAPAIMLLAGAVISILNIIDEISPLESLVRLLVVLILFYIIGRIATKIIRKATAPKVEEVEENQDLALDEFITTEEETENKDQESID